MCSLNDAAIGPSSGIMNDDSSDNNKAIFGNKETVSFSAAGIIDSDGN